MLKKSASGVLTLLRGSTYGGEYASPLRSLRPCARDDASRRVGVGRVRMVAFLNILRARIMPQSQDPFYAGLGQAVRIGTELLAALIVGGGLGWAIDTYLLGTTPWGLVIGLIVGAAAGVRNAYRMAQRWPK
jgi:ATP synthase protein I